MKYRLTTYHIPFRNYVSQQYPVYLYYEEYWALCSGFHSEGFCVFNLNSARHCLKMIRRDSVYYSAWKNAQIHLS